MADMKFVRPPRYTLYGITPEGAAGIRSGAKTMEEVKDEIWRLSKSYPALTWRVFEAVWTERDLAEE